MLPVTRAVCQRRVTARFGGAMNNKESELLIIRRVLFVHSPFFGLGPSTEVII